MDDVTQDPGQTQDTPEPSAPQETGHAPSAGETPDDAPNWEQRYSDLQPEYTRATQEAAQYREIIEAARAGDPEALEMLGLDLTDDEPDTPQEPDDPYITREEWQQYQQQIAQAQEQAMQEAQWAEAQQATIEAIDEGLAAISQRIGRELTDDEIGFIAPRALASSEDGSPDVEGAWNALEALQHNTIRSYAEGKLKPPRVPDGRSADTKPPDRSTREGRDEFARQRLRELEQAQTFS